MTRRLASTPAIAALVGLVVTLGCQPAPDAPAVTTTPAVADDTAPPVAIPPENLKALVEANNALWG